MIFKEIIDFSPTGRDSRKQALTNLKLLLRENPFKMFLVYVYKAYINALGGPSVLNLTHDVKRCIADSKMTGGQINVISTGGSTGVVILEQDEKLCQEYLKYVETLFDGSSKDGVSRRSRTGANCFHHRAAFVGLSLTVSFEQGRLLTSPFHEIYALDFEPAAGRREFVMTVVGAAGK